MNTLQQLQEQFDKQNEMATRLADIPQPDANGEFASPVAGALFMAMTYGIPQAPLNGKVALLKDWPAQASTEPTQIKRWEAEYPGCNFSSVFTNGKFAFEADLPPEGIPRIHERFKSATGKQFSETLTVSSSPGKGHRYYETTSGVEAISQSDAKHADFSVRIGNQYCVSPGSIHPETGQQYRIIKNLPIVLPAPEEITFWNSERQNEKPATKVAQQLNIPEGRRVATLVSKVSTLLKSGLSPESVQRCIEELNQERCEPPLTEKQLNEEVFPAIGRWKNQPDSITTNRGLVLDYGAPQAEPIEIPKLDTFTYPVFPSWVMKGCSMYDGYIQPLCDANNRYAEMMFVPGMAMLLNYLGTKLRINRFGKIDGAMVNLVGKKGRVMKSSSVQDMFMYFQLIRIMDHYNYAIRVAQGKTLIWTAGSTEGLGHEANQSSCKNMILYFDELKTLADKAGIEGSSMGGHLLSMLQSAKFQNSTKSSKTNFSFEPGTYSASVITCCTDRMFSKYWSKLIAFSDGLEDRATLILQPEHLKEVTERVYIAPDTEQIAREKQLIEKARLQQNFEIEDECSFLLEFGKKYGQRSMARAQEWAVGFAVQMGKTVVDGGCIERGIALEQYNINVKRYLNVREAETREAVIQNHIVQVLMQNQGRVSIRELNKRIRPDRLGTWLWSQSYNGLLTAGITMETGTGKTGDPKTLVLLQAPERDDE